MARGAAARGGPAAGPGPGPTHRRRSMSPGRMGPGRMAPGPAGPRRSPAKGTGNADIERGVRSIVRGVTRRRRGL